MKTTSILGAAGILSFVVNSEIFALMVLTAAVFLGIAKFAKAALIEYERRYDDAES